MRLESGVERVRGREAGEGALLFVADASKAESRALGLGRRIGASSKEGNVECLEESAKKRCKRG